MNGAFYIGAAGLHAQQRALEVTANNITNVNTNGFKRGEVRFSELVGSQAPGEAAARAAATPMLGVSTASAARVFEQGEIRETGSQLDVAISGEGFIELLGPDGEVLLWRGGPLKVNEDGYLAAGNGLVLKAMISVPEDATGVSIDRDGEVRVVTAGSQGAESVGRLELARVRDVATLTSIEGGLYRPDQAAEILGTTPEEGGGTILQGSIELSNVELTDEMVMLMMTQRAYAASAQIVQAGDQLMGIANSLKR